MNKRILTAVVFCNPVAFTTPGLGQKTPGGTEDQPECKSPSAQNRAMNCPDLFAWELFAKVN